MSEDQNTNQPTASAELRPNEVVAIVKNPAGSHAMARGEHGRFTRGLQKKVEKSTRLHQRILSKKVKREDGSEVTLEQAVVEHLLKTILESGADHLSGSGKTLQGILDRAYGKIPPAPQEPKPPITVIIQPPELMHPEPVYECPPKPLKPVFLDDGEGAGAITGEYVEAGRD